MSFTISVTLWNSVFSLDPQIYPIITYWSLLSKPGIGSAAVSKTDKNLSDPVTSNSEVPLSAAGFLMLKLIYPPRLQASSPLVLRMLFHPDVSSPPFRFPVFIWWYCSHPPRFWLPASSPSPGLAPLTPHPHLSEHICFQVCLPKFASFILVNMVQDAMTKGWPFSKCNGLRECAGWRHVLIQTQLYCLASNPKQVT